MNSRLVILILTLTCACGLSAQTAVGDVLINEFCYDSNNNVGTSTGPDLEWLELYNTTAAAIDLSNWEIRDNSGVVVIPAASTIGPGEYFVISLTGNATIFERYTGWPVDYANTSTWSGLGNGGDGLAIFTSAGAGNVCIDYVQYGGGNTVPGAPTWSGTRPPDITGANDFSYSRIPAGTDGDATPGDAGSEQAATTFIASPFTPGRENGGTVVDCYVPDEFADHYTGGSTVGSPIQTLVPRDTSDPLRMTINLPPSYDFTTTSSFGFPNTMGIRARYHDTGATVAVSFAVNGTETTASTSTLTLPSGGNMSTLIDLLSYTGSITGQLPGTPGSIVIDITCAVSGGATTVFKLQIDVDAPQITTSPNLDDVLEAQTSQVMIAASGGATPYSWSLANQPAWVSINPGSGQLTMSPPTSSAGNYTFDVIVSDDNSPARVDSVTFDVSVVEALDITTTSLATIPVGDTPGETIVVTGGTASFNFVLTGAPGWLSIGATTGVFSGTAPATGVFSFDVEVTDSGTPAQSDTQNLTLTVVDTVTITSSATLPNGEETETYNFTFTATGGTTPYVWTATGLPAFLGLNPNSGLLSGIPTNSDAGTYNFDVTVTDASTPQQDATLPCTLVIDPLNGVGGGGGGGSSDGGGCVAGAGAPVAPLILIGLLAWRRRKDRS